MRLAKPIEISIELRKDQVLFEHLSIKTSKDRETLPAFCSVCQGVFRMTCNPARILQRYLLSLLLQLNADTIQMCNRAADIYQIAAVHSMPNRSFPILRAGQKQVTQEAPTLMNSKSGQMTSFLCQLVEK